MNPATLLSAHAPAPASAPAGDLLDLAGLEPAGLAALLDLAEDLAEAPQRHAGSLAGRGVACFFEQPSTRTRVSLQVAVHRLGGLPVVLSPAELQLGRGEPLSDTARILGSYCDAIVARVCRHETVEALAHDAGVPVLNALSDRHHPLQALADLLTLRQRFGTLAGLRVAFVGDGSSNVCHSLLEAGALSGLDVAVAAPPGYEPDGAVLERAAALADDGGGQLSVVHDAAEAVHDADAVYADTWVSMGQDAERAERLAALAPFQVDAGLLRRAAPHAVFLHCLPAHRGEEVTAEVIDGPRSLVFQQAANRLCTTQAALLAALGQAHGEGLTR